MEESRTRNEITRVAAGHLVDCCQPREALPAVGGHHAD